MQTYFDLNPESIPYLNRLEREWKQYGKIIIAVDFDDTISPWKLEGFDPTETIDILKIACEVGAYIAIFSACNPDRYDDIRSYCHEIGLQVDSINKTPIDLPYGKNGKIYANIYVDDRGGINEALRILELAAYRVRGTIDRVGDFDI